MSSDNTFSYSMHQIAVKYYFLNSIKIDTLKLPIKFYVAPFVHFKNMVAIEDIYTPQYGIKQTATAFGYGLLFT